MRKIMKKRVRRGFTLVELLIVIIIIGVLAGMMMLSTGSATDKAEATKIVSDLRSIKSACLLYYADNGAWPSADVNIDVVKDYIDQTPGDGYGIKVDGSKIFSTYTGTKLTEGVAAKLKDMAKDAGLKEGTASDQDYNGGDTVGMVIRK
ncbi:MAG: prepilin-type N-terminal cleavage/methylation domain-containing protein [Synergistes sp.]|nr:prepilin-type N-terminal cleavage/methylation domain-containing protein [Synergistes sp.]